MDIKRKLHLAEQSIRLITRADDTDSAVRSAALDRLGGFIDAERQASHERLTAVIEEHDSPAEPEPKKKGK